MKGFIYKDLLGLKQVGLTMLLLMGFYLAMGMMSGSTDTTVTYFSMMILVINVMIPLTCAGYDEQCGWDSFGAALPVSRKQAVAARYLTSLLVMAASLLLVLILDIIYRSIGGYTMDFFTYLYPLFGAMLYVSLMNPIIYKFGVQKSRFIVIAIMLIPMLLAFAIMIIFLRDEPSEATADALDAAITAFTLPSPALLGGMAAAAAVIYVLSMLLSMHIYQKKDL